MTNDFVLLRFWARVPEDLCAAEVMLYYSYYIATFTLPKGSARVVHLGLFICLFVLLSICADKPNSNIISPIDLDFVHTRRSNPQPVSSSKIIPILIEIWTLACIEGFFTIAR